MSLETAINIGDLNPVNPTAADAKSQGDDHFRMIKTTLKNAFAGFTGSVCVTGVDGGVADVYTLTPAQPVPAYTNKMLIEFTPAATNTTVAPTLNVSGLGAKTIKSVSNAALQAGDLVAGTPVLATYDGTSIRLLGATKNYIDQLSFASALPSQPGGATPAVLRSISGAASWGEPGVKGADIASAATINLGTATGDYVHVTGTTAITAITIPVGAERTVVFDGALTLTHGAALLVPGAVNLLTAAGDRMVVRGDTTGAVVTSYTKANGRAVSASAGGLAVITASGSFTIPATDFEVVLIGGGGGGSGGAAAGGPSGGTVIKRFTGATIGAAATVVIGSGGAGGSAGGSSPGDGGDSSFALSGFTTLAAGGGKSTVPSVGTATGGDINIIGQRGTNRTYDGTGSDQTGGTGGATPYGFGGVGSNSGLNVATGYGSGGGAGTFYGSVNSAGGAGKAGVLIVRY